LLAGLDDPTSGTIHIGDRNVHNVEPKDRDVAMVFQNYALYPHMTVFKNMAFGLKMRRMPKTEIAARVAETADLLGIGHLLDRKPGSLSGGEQQRVALGRAIVRTPAVFLFDEPLSNLDAALRSRMRLEIKELHRKLGATIVYVTHDQEEAVTLGDRIVVMNGGAVQQCGPPSEIYQRPSNRFVAGFIGTPSMNFLQGTIVRDGTAARFESPLGKLILPEKVVVNGEGSVVLGIRPEDVRIAGPTDGPTRTGLHSDPANWAVLAEMSVHMVEPLGGSMDVHLTSSRGDRIVARLRGTTKLSLADRVEVQVDLSAAHLFSPDDGGHRLN
ncbi:MAG: ATP-binding cassette domain-containing protein, partial [Planctomycetes bacterium]|nr:ATP-binding cassette domain-containing protein [Planctomycetota bacterium]